MKVSIIRNGEVIWRRNEDYAETNCPPLKPGDIIEHHDGSADFVLYVENDKPMITDVAFYRNKMMDYGGLLPLLYCLSHFEEKENYEECAKIIKALEAYEEQYGVEPIRDLSPKSIKKYKEGFKVFGVSGDIAVKNAPEYARRIIQEVEG